jgi:hypothetical protein
MLVESPNQYQFSVWTQVIFVSTKSTLNLETVGFLMLPSFDSDDLVLQFDATVLVEDFGTWKPKSVQSEPSVIVHREDNDFCFLAYCTSFS